MGFGGTKPLGTLAMRFVELFDGDGAKTAIAAGYAPDSANRTAYRLLNDPRVAQLIEEREKRSTKPLIRSRVKRQEWLVSIIEDVAVEMRDRLKAMEMLKRSCGDFLDRVEVTNRHTVELPEMDAETLRMWARKTLPQSQPQVEEEAEVVGPH